MVLGGWDKRLSLKFEGHWGRTGGASLVNCGFGGAGLEFVLLSGCGGGGGGGGGSVVLCGCVLWLSWCCICLLGL